MNYYIIFKEKMIRLMLKDIYNAKGFLI